jgi:hypothetical protein
MENKGILTGPSLPAVGYHAAGWDVKLTATERNQNAVRALLKLIPHVGEAADRLIFGTLDDLRYKRLEQTLSDVLWRLEQMGATPTQAEEFANLFERAKEKIARATSEDVRARFRDLLTNAAQVPSGDVRWGEAELAEQLLSELDGPALAVLAAVARLRGDNTTIVLARPTPHVAAWKSLNEPQPELQSIAVSYAWPVMEEWIRRLMEKRLIGGGAHSDVGYTAI